MDINTATIVILVYLLPFWLLLALVVAVQARRRGYSFFVWWLAVALGNPIFFLILLALLPDQARKTWRRRFTAALEKKLAVLPRRSPEPSRGIAQPDRSVGDQTTVAPPAHSLGDEETRA
jgi:hypothetical protein